SCFSFSASSPPRLYPLSLHDALPIYPPAVSAATVRAVVAEAARVAPGLPLVAGGKSFGGRMTSTAQAEEPLPGVRGLVFLGFPRSEEHTSELQSLAYLVCRLLLEKKK